VHQNAANIACTLQAAAKEQGDQPCPGTSFDAKPELEDCTYSVDDAENDIAGKIGIIAVGCCSDGTLWSDLGASIIACHSELRS